MRMICPNCGAQYEVDDAVIPDQGRDVQCSSCGHTWFQQPAHHDDDLVDELDLPPVEQPEEAHELPPEPEPAGVPEPEPELEPEAPLQRRGLDPDIADVLRQEAKHEAAARKAEADGLESQPDLGLEDSTADIAASRSAAARARMARLRGQEDSGPEAEAAMATLAASVGSRKELLPDVEEINSTLRASQDRDGTDDTSVEPLETMTEPERRGSRLLSRLIILGAIIAVLVYMFAPQIINAVPQAEAYLVPYIDWANGLRGQINGLINTVVGKVQGLIGGGAEG